MARREMFVEQHSLLSNGNGPTKTPFTSVHFQEK